MATNDRVIKQICEAFAPAGVTCKKMFGEYGLFVDGKVFALVCDALGKWVFAPFELPVGIILALLGGPFFLFLLLKGGRGKIYD